MSYEVKAGILKSPKYLADMLPDDVKVDVDLSANENSLGPSPQAIAAYEKAVQDIWRYPDGTCLALRQAIAKQYGLNHERIVCGAGSDELITLLIRAFAGEGDEILFPEYSFIMYQINAVRVGAAVVKVPTQDFEVNVDDILSRITSRTKMILIANPNNPTGTYIQKDALAQLVSKVPENIILVIDAAYAEYLDDPNYEDGHTWVETHKNFVMLRTFSKIHGLAGLRLGWSYAQEALTDILERSRGPYNVSIPAQMAGIAAIQDTKHVLMSRQHNQHWLPIISQGFEDAGFSVTPSVGNFVLVDFKTESQQVFAYKHFLKNGILTRPLKGYNLPHHLRITIGKGEDNKRLLEACKCLKELCHAEKSI